MNESRRELLFSLSSVFWSLLEKAKKGEQTIKFNEIKKAAMALKDNYEIAGHLDGKAWPVDQEIRGLVDALNSHEFLFTEASCAGHIVKIVISYNDEPGEITQEELDLIPEKTRRQLYTTFDSNKKLYKLFTNDKNRDSVRLEYLTDGEILYKGGYIGFYCDSTEPKASVLIKNIKELCESILPEAKIIIENRGSLIWVWIEFYPPGNKNKIKENEANEQDNKKKIFITELTKLILQK